MELASVVMICSAFLSEGSVLTATKTARKQTSRMVFPGKACHLLTS